jgi:hypothetical protein
MVNDPDTIIELSPTPKMYRIKSTEKPEMVEKH